MILKNLIDTAGGHRHDLSSRQRQEVTRSMGPERDYPQGVTIVVVRIHQYDMLLEPGQSSARAEMYRRLEVTLAHIWEVRSRLDDLGGGLRILWTLDVPKAEILKALARLADDPPPSLRLAIAIHQGGVLEDESGLSGKCLEVAGRLASSRVLAKALDRSGASVAMLLAEPFHAEIVRTGWAGAVGDLRETRVRDGWERQRAWLSVPKLPSTRRSRGWIRTAGISAGILLVVLAVVAGFLLINGSGEPHASGRAPDGGTTQTSPADPRASSPTPPLSRSASASPAHSSPGAPSTSSSRPRPPSEPPTSALPRMTTGSVVTEYADWRGGVAVYSDTKGTASNLPAIPFDTGVQVECWAPNNTAITSINRWYLIHSGTWAGTWASANEFTNGGQRQSSTAPNTDARVQPCGNN